VFLILSNLAKAEVVNPENIPVIVNLRCGGPFAHIDIAEDAGVWDDLLIEMNYTIPQSWGCYVRPALMTSDKIMRLEKDDLIGSFLPYSSIDDFAYFYDDSGNGEFFNQTGYVGLKLTDGADTYYGWALVETSNCQDFELAVLIVVDWAYENIPGESILAGEGADTCEPCTESLCNPSMEYFTGLVAEYWTSWQDDYFINSFFCPGSYQSHEGSMSQMISWGGSGSDNGIRPAGIYQQMTQLQQEQVYQASVWFKFGYGIESEEEFDSAELYFSIGIDSNGGTNPDDVTYWNTKRDGGASSNYLGPWIKCVTCFSPNDTNSTLFIKASGGCEISSEYAWWNATCYIDDVNLQPIQISPESNVAATTPIPGNGMNYSEVTITVVDVNGEPVESIPPSEINISCTGSGNIILGPDEPTDENGQTTARILTNIAEEKIISATVWGTVLSDTASVQFCESNLSKLLASDGANGDNFGTSVAIDGNTALVGARYDDDNGFNSGSVYIFRFDGENWIEEAKFLASDGAEDDYFGYSVAIDGNKALVGAYRDDDNGTNSGSAYIFRFDGENWVEEAKLLASDGEAYDYFGYSVAIDVNTALVGAYGDDDNDSSSGSAYIFRFDGENWVEEEKLLASDGTAYDEYGYSVAIDVNTALIGAYKDDVNGSNSGSAYIFRFDGENWVEEAKLLASDGANGDRFGYSVAIDDNTTLVGAYYDDDNGYNSGSAYIFRYNESSWVEEAKLLAFDGAAYDYFGYSVAIDGNIALVGASHAYPNSAYLFRLDDENWVEEAKLLALDGAYSDYFGDSVAIDGNRALIGARGDDDNGNNSGSAYVFPALSGDLDNDGDLDMFDFAILANQWLGEPSVPSADIAPCGGDCVVDFEDLTEFCEHWLEGTTP